MCRAITRAVAMSLSSKLDDDAFNSNIATISSSLFTTGENRRFPSSTSIAFRSFITRWIVSSVSSNCFTVVRCFSESNVKSPNADAIYTVQLSQPSKSDTTISLTISRSRLTRWIRSRASKSTNNKVVAPSAHPKITPITAPPMATLRAIGSCRCAALSAGVLISFRRVKNRSSVPPKTTPETSETTCPIAYRAVKVSAQCFQPSRD